MKTLTKNLPVALATAAMAFAAPGEPTAEAIDPLTARWIFGAHEPMTMYRRMGRRSTGAIDGNALWTRAWLNWFDDHAPEKMAEMGFNWIHSRFYKGMDW